MQIIILLTTCGILFFEGYIFQAIKTVFKKKWQRILYYLLSGIVYLIEFYFIITFNSNQNLSLSLKEAVICGVLVGLILPKFFILLFLLIDDIFRVLQYVVKKKTIGSDEVHYPQRRKFLSMMGLGTAGLFTLLIADGIFLGRHRFQVRRLKIKIKNLPEAFKNYRIVQISDVHIGSFFSVERLEKAIDLINEQKPDLVLFTGDMVNYKAEEFIPFISLFSQIKAKDGKLSVLGNHDYGTYVYTSKKDLDDNVKKLIDFEEKAGFQVLRNEFKIIKKDNQELYIVGVENWGLPPFPQFGDLDKATAGIPQNAAKILMSHDPTHFDAKVKNHPSDIPLTLSGHTHGMQFGLDLKNVKWSPAQYKYPKWMDLYESNHKYLYVNRGFGMIAFPGRVGINPEITVFELK